MITFKERTQTKSLKEQKPKRLLFVSPPQKIQKIQERGRDGESEIERAPRTRRRNEGLFLKKKKNIPMIEALKSYNPTSTIDAASEIGQLIC